MTLNCSSAPPAIDSDVRGLDSRRAHANGDLKAPSHHTYRPDIDGLRAIAVLSVVIFHAFPARFAGGFIGVDMFFVISGFLISSIIFNGLEQNNFSFVSFFSRRIKRIFPGLILVLLASLLFGWFALLPDEYRQLGKHIASGAGFIANFVFWGESGYFDNVAETKPLLHLWSLGIEEQFYLVWPFILWIAWGWRLNILGVTLGIFAVSFALNVWTVHWDTVAAFYSPQTRFWELLAGSILAYTALYRRSADTFIATSQNNRPPQVSFLRARKSIRNKICCALSILGVALILIGFSIVSKEQRFPGWWAMLPTAGTIMIISAGTKSWLNHQFLSNRVLVWFGLISFPLYLWHWPLLAFCRIVEGGIPSPQVRIAAILTSIGLAWLTFTFVEKPIRRFKHDRMAAFVLLLFLVFTGFGGFVCYEWGGFKYRSSLSSTSLNEAINAEFVGPLWKYTKNDLCQERYPFKESAEYSWWFCMANKDENPSLLLLGNSFANQLYPGFAKNPLLDHHSILSIGTCDPATVDESQLASPISQSPCSGNRPFRQQQFIDKIIRNSGSIKFAILDGLERSPDSSYISRLQKRVKALERQQITVIIFIPHLKIDYEIKACFSRPLRAKTKDCSLDLSERKTLMANFKPLVNQLSRTNPNVRFFDQNDLFCDANKCSMIHKEMPLLRDAGHISEYGSVELSRLFTKWANANVPTILNETLKIGGASI